MSNQKIVRISESNVIIAYRKERHSFNIEEIESLEILEKRFYFYDVLRLLLMLLLIPLVLFHKFVENYIPIYALILFWSLFTKYNQKRYVLQISLRNSLIVLKIDERERAYFISEIIKIQDLLYSKSTQPKLSVM